MYDVKMNNKLYKKKKIKKKYGEEGLPPSPRVGTLFSPRDPVPERQNKILARVATYRDTAILLILYSTHQYEFRFLMLTRPVVYSVSDHSVPE